MSDFDDLEDFNDVKKKRKRLVISLSEDIMNRLDDHINSAGYDRSRLVEKILKIYLSKIEKK